MGEATHCIKEACLTLRMTMMRPTAPHRGRCGPQGRLPCDQGASVQDRRHVQGQGRKARRCQVPFTGIDIFTGKKLEAIAPASAGLSQPIVERNEYEMCDISDDDFVTLMDASGNMREDIKVPEDPETAKKLRARMDEGITTMVTVLKAMGAEQIIDMKDAAN